MRVALVGLIIFSSHYAFAGESLLASSGWARFQITLGRIQVANIHSSQTRTATRGGGDRFERLTISGDTDTPSVRYEREPDSVLITVIDGDRVQITSRDVKFLQRPNEVAALRVGESTYQGETLWHLAVKSPEACEEHLFPLLAIMEPGWKLREMILSAQELIRESHSVRRDARRLVAKLSRRDFAVREQAQRQLCGLGVGALPYLDHVASHRLTRDQLRRVEIAQGRLRDRGPDCPEVLAAWLSEDRLFNPMEVRK